MKTEHDLSATPSIIPHALAGFARQADILGTQLSGAVITTWTADPPLSAVDHLLRLVNREWQAVKQRSIAAHKELEVWQRKATRARAAKAKQRATDMCRSQADEYTRLCKEVDALEARTARLCKEVDRLEGHPISPEGT